MITIERRLAARHPDLRVVTLTVSGVTVERTSADLEELKREVARDIGCAEMCGDVLRCF
jgi:hypothetical protein